MFIPLRVYIPFVIPFLQLAYSTKPDCHPDERYVSLYECSHVYKTAWSWTLMREYDIDVWRRDRRICCPPPGNRIPSTDICGQSPLVPRIVGGSDARPHEFPWMAMLLYLNRSSLEILPLCAGSLINNRYVVTSAHCVLGVPDDLSLKNVRLGEHDITNNPAYDPKCRNQASRCALPNLEVGVEEIIVHGRFNSSFLGRIQNDIALLRLKMPVRYSTGIQPICLQNPDPFTKSRFEVAGWGITNNGSFSRVLQRGVIREKELRVCAGRIRFLDFNVHSQICAGGDGGVDTCSGDSGGPLMATVGRMDNTRIYLAGITSYGSQKCGAIGFPGVYTKTSAFLGWIRGLLRP
ncbi:spaetzle-processing enzyme [Drosophila yakuba]|uniref:spaetzle-processing enzyme n=1 Tax=Drosophila yakuba TaxID=7245 RepID=UPI0019308A92|nr:spaetzle-processing enzyme [Drosophila yakuba]